MGRKLKEDKEFILDAVSQNGLVLQYAKFQDDKDVVLEAVSQNGLVLQYAYKFQEDQDIVLAAVKKDLKALEHASDELKKDYHFLQRIAKCNKGAKISLNMFEGTGIEDI